MMDDYVQDGGRLVMDTYSKKRRMDGELKRAVSCAALERKTATTSSAFVRAHPELGHRSEQKFDLSFVTSYQASMWLSFASAQTICWCWDSVRSGNPMKENVFSFVINLDNQNAGWLIPVDRLSFCFLSAPIRACARERVPRRIGGIS